VDLALSRGDWRIWLRIVDNKDFPLNLVDPILETMAFPGEALYVEAQRLGLIKMQAPSPYVVSLRRFSNFGRKVKQGRTKFDVEYRGAAVSDQQRQAVERLVGDEEQLYEEVRLAVFRYYSEYIYPLLTTEVGRNDKLWPFCQTVEEIMRLVKLSSLVVHEPREDGAIAIGLRFHCSWDEEHAMGLRAVGSGIEAVGSDFVALDSRGSGWPEFQAASRDPAN
jgi:hypothetical protein